MPEVAEAPVQDTPAAAIPLPDPFAQFDATPAPTPTPTPNKAVDGKRDVTVAEKTFQPSQRDPGTKDAKPPETPEKPAERPTEKPPEEKPSAEVPTEKMAPKMLRESYDRLKAQMREREKELETLRKGAAPKDDPEKLELTKRYEELEKRHKALDDEIRFIDYEKSTEFKTQYYQPYVDRCQNAVTAVSELKIPKEDGTSRPATAEDLWKIVEIPNHEDALAAAEALFGTATKANFVVALRNDIRQANSSMQKAKQDFRQQGSQRFEQMEKQAKLEGERMDKEWKTLNDTAVEKYPQWFKADEGDTKGAELLAKGFELADLAFSGKVSPEKRLALHSAIRNQAAGFRHVVHKWELAAARVKELEKKLADYEKSAPGPGDGKPGTTKKDELADPFARFEK